MRIKFNDKIYRLKEVESGVDSLMELVELVEEPRYKHGDFFISLNRIAFILDREGKNGEAHHLFAIDIDDISRKYIQDAGEYAHCSYIKDCTIADQKAIKIIHDGLKSIGKRWNAEKKCIEDIPKRKFKAGDKVRIKDGISSKTHGNIKPIFTPGMDAYIGRKLTVKEYIGNGRVIFSEDIYGPIFDENWLEPWSDEPKKGDLAIFWDTNKDMAVVRFYRKMEGFHHIDITGGIWRNAVKFESKEQFERFIKGEV